MITAGPTMARHDRVLICAFVAVYRHHRARSQHLARPGARVRLTVIVERVTAQPSGRYGAVFRCELLDAEADKLVWWQTQGPPLHAGEVLALYGRLERHTHFGFVPVTVLSHCRRAAGLSERTPRRDRGIRAPAGYLRGRSEL